ncbi:MAG: hypothetical protein J5654_09495 [Victivallales bacterium]|nr:hypothetical protein [Victivallales bacterium]
MNGNELSIFDVWHMNDGQPFDDSFFEDVRGLEKQATQLKKDSPDEAIELLKQAEQLELAHGWDPFGPLMLRLRIATICYEHGRFSEASKLLMLEFRKAREIQITETTRRRAEERFKNRMYVIDMERKRWNKEPMPFELKRNIGEWPDFERNLYCLRIYEKLRVCHTRQKDYRTAILWAFAEAYAEYENQTHIMYNDNALIELSTAKKLLNKVKCKELIQELEAHISKFTEEPICEKCWDMLDSILPILQKIPQNQ